MKKILLFLFLFSLQGIMIAQQSIYSRVKIYTDSKTPAQLFETGIEINGTDKNNNGYIAEISQEEISKIAASGFRYDVLIEDMAKFYKERFAKKTSVSETDIQLNQSWPQPANFSLGSCGGFSTVDEMKAQLDLMRSLYLSLVSVKTALSDTISTIEGRTIYYVRISDNPDVNEPEPEVLYTGMHHAREPIGMQHLLYYMWYLLENYNSDPSIKDLVDNTEMYFVPVFNVDGYTYNVTTNPAGGGMWRKNRRDSGSGNFGIDINRNYGYQWGYDNTGSSPNPASDVYRGTAAFSEPETRMMKYFCQAHNFLIALNYHSYSGLFLSPWGWTQEQCVDSTILDAYANEMTLESGYIYGPGSTTIYPTNGGSDDWMYGEHFTKPAILSYTPEVGNSDDGFWPSQDRILPLIRQNMLSSVTAARLVLNYGSVTDLSSLFIYELSGYLPFKVKRLGQQNGSFTVSVTPLGNAFASVGNAKTIESLPLLGEQADSISYELSNSLHVGDTIQYILHIDNGYYFSSDTITRIFGYPVTVFDDNFNDNSQWTGIWGITSSQYFSPSSCITDSPNGNYLPNANKTLTMNAAVKLPDVLLLVLQFRAKWTLEEDFDYVQLSISTNNGTTWIPVKGKYTQPGSVYQPYGSPVYDGKQGEWVREAISLNDYMGSQIKLRFKLKADQGTEFDGFYLDDFNISMLLDPTGIQKTGSAAAFLGNPYPNPATGHFEVSYLLPEATSNSELQLSTPTGTVISRTKLNQKSGTAGIDIGDLVPGIYFVCIKSDGVQSPVHKLIVR